MTENDLEILDNSYDSDKSRIEELELLVMNLHNENAELKKENILLAQKLLTLQEVNKQLMSIKKPV